MNLRAVALLCGTAIAPVAFGDFFVTSRDGGSGDLYRYSLAGTFVAKYPGNGLNNGQGATIGVNGNLLVSNETNGNVLQYNPTTGAFIGVFATGTAAGPLTIGPDNNLYAPGNNGGTVLKVNGTTGAIIGTFATG